MKKYKARGKYYTVIDDGSLKYPVGALRPTKNAAGMAYTAARSNHRGNITHENYLTREHNKDMLSLNLRGTCDTLTRKSYRVEKLPCQSCGCKCRGKLKLKDN